MKPSLGSFSFIQTPVERANDGRRVNLGLPYLFLLLLKLSIRI